MKRYYFMQQKIHFTFAFFAPLREKYFKALNLAGLHHA